jgi:hypothetical protein
MRLLITHLQTLGLRTQNEEAAHLVLGRESLCHHPRRKPERDYVPRTVEASLDDRFSYVENPKEPTEKLFELISGPVRMQDSRPMCRCKAIATQYH